jgi:hypothetical protein
MPFTLGGEPYYVAYKTTNGFANLDRINAVGNGASTVWSAWWGKGWTHLVPFTQGGVQYFLAYQGSTGAVEIDKITGSGNYVAITEVWAGTWSTGWSHIVPVKHNGSTHLVKYKNTGYVSFEKVNSGGEGTTYLGNSTWTENWTAFSPYSINGVGHILLYRISNGDTKVVKLDADGGGVSTVWFGVWTLGWS